MKQQKLKTQVHDHNRSIISWFREKTFFPQNLSKPLV